MCLAKLGLATLARVGQVVMLFAVRTKRSYIELRKIHIAISLSNVVCGVARRTVCSGTGTCPLKVAYLRPRDPRQDMGGKKKIDRVGVVRV